MSLPNELLPVGLLGTGAAGGYQIERSLRFNSADSAFLSRTPTLAGNRKTFTWSGWVKRAKLTDYDVFFEAYQTATPLRFLVLGFNGSSLEVSGDDASNNTIFASSLGSYRDPSAWYHIVCSVDTTQATASDRISIYVNGIKIGFYYAIYPLLNADLDVNTLNSLNTIGKWSYASRYFNGYLADIHFIDGQALTPSSFGEFDDNGVWQPKAYDGTYGTNGFRLDFSDNSTAAALGTDTSGNGNTWTVNNLSVTAGAGNDSLVDSPTSYGSDTGAGGSVRGNYATLNPLDNGGLSLANGNLDAENTGASNIGCRSNFVFPSSGKWYCEATASTLGGNLCFGISLGNQSAAVAIAGNHHILINSSFFTVQRYNGTSGITYSGFSAYSTGAILQIAFDADNQKVWFGLNNTWMDSGTTATGNPATGVNATLTGLTNVFPSVSLYTSKIAVNFGLRPFAYTAPSGFKALCTTNLPEPTIADGSTAMDVLLWTGDGSSPRSFTGLSFSPDLVWIKQRSSTADHALIDTVRGPAGNSLSSNLATAESAAGLTVNSFDSNGFTLATGSLNFSYANTNAATYAAWAWDAGSSTVTNNDGSITSQVRANASAGFSVVTYTGGGGGSTMGHGLGVTPSLIIAKSRTATGNWSVNGNVGGLVYGTNKLLLNSIDAISADTNEITAANSTTFTGGGSAATSGSGVSYVAYCFAPVAGYSSFGSYTGNGSADGAFTYLGFLPKLILIKRTDTTSNWTILDTLREGYNVDNDPLYPNLSNAEGTTDLLDINSNGFKLRTTVASVNASGGTYIFAAWASNPFQYSRAR